VRLFKYGNTNIIEEEHMIHLVFSQSVAGCIKIALSNLGLSSTYNIHALWDYFSAGPIKDLHCEKGIEERFQWKHKHLINELNQFEECETNYYETWKYLDSIPKGESITIWAGENALEQTGLRYAALLMKERPDIDLFVINTTMKYIKLLKQPKRFYIPYYSGEIPPEKMAVIYNHSKIDPPLTDHERVCMLRDWKEISAQNQSLRLWRNGRLNGAAEDYYDDFILDTAKGILTENKNEFIRAVRIIGDVIGQIDQAIDDGFIEYRLRKLIEQGVMEAIGNFTNMRCYSVRLLHR
jgi:Protein of unknown function/Domain of unknown function (DUF1835)